MRTIKGQSIEGQSGPQPREPYRPGQFQSLDGYVNNSTKRWSPKKLDEMTKILSDNPVLEEEGCQDGGSSPGQIIPPDSLGVCELELRDSN